MKVFVAGATGVVGRPLVRGLVAAGHEVTGMTRSAVKIAELEAAGARGVVADALDRDALRTAVLEARPEAVIHQLTDLPSEYDTRGLTRAYEANDRIRRATSSLVDAALQGGASRFVAQSIAFAYAPEGSWVKDEGAPLWTDAPAPFDASVAAVLELERAVLGLPERQGVVLRYGFFYGPGTYYDARGGSFATETRRRRFPVVGRGTGTFSFVHVDDAAAAAIAALDAPPGVYNVCDDEPATMREWLPVYAETLGARRPLRVPKLVGRLAAGRFTAELATSLRGASNAKARGELGWTPRWTSWREGFRTAPGQGAG